MFSFDKNSLVIDCQFHPNTIIFDYSPAEISYLCFTSKHNRSDLCKLISDKLRDLKIKLPMELTHMNSIEHQLLQAYKFPLVNDKLLRYMMQQYDCSPDECSEISRVSSTEIDLKSSQMDYNIPSIIEHIFDNDPQYTISLLYYEHKYIILILTMIYARCCNVRLIFNNLITKWFNVDDMNRLHSDISFQELLNTLGYLHYFDPNTDISSTVESLQHINDLVFDNILRDSDIHQYGTKLYQRYGVCNRYVDSDVYNRKHIIESMYKNIIHVNSNDVY